MTLEKRSTLLHVGKSLFEKIQIASPLRLSPGRFDKLLLIFVFSGLFLLVINAELAWPFLFRQGKGYRPYSLRRALLHQSHQTRHPYEVQRHRRLPVEFDAFAQALDDRKSVVVDRSLIHFHHVLDLCRMRASTKVAPLESSFRIGLVGRSMAPVGSVFERKP